MFVLRVIACAFMKQLFHETAAVSVWDEGQPKMIHDLTNRHKSHDTTIQVVPVPSQCPVPQCHSTTCPVPQDHSALCHSTICPVPQYHGTTAPCATVPQCHSTTLPQYQCLVPQWRLRAAPGCGLSAHSECSVEAGCGAELSLARAGGRGAVQ